MAFPFPPSRRSAQRTANNNAPIKARVLDMPNTDRGGFCGALQRTPPAIPAGLARRLANKENYGMGKVSVLRHIYACLLHSKFVKMKIVQVIISN